MIQSEATQESTVTNQPEFLYCIEHEEMVKAEEFNSGMGHLKETTGESPEIDVCHFESGYAYCPPPDELGLPLDWAAEQISDDERAQIELDEIGFWLR